MLHPGCYLLAEKPAMMPQCCINQKKMKHDYNLCENDEGRTCIYCVVCMVLDSCIHVCLLGLWAGIHFLIDSKLGPLHWTITKGQGWCTYK